MSKRALILLTVVSLVLLQVSPAFAVSSISNGYWKSRTYYSGGNWGSFQTRTRYDHIAGLPTNPYTSDYYSELNYRHFNKPNITGYSGVSPSFSYRADGKKTGGDPAWYYYSGIFWVFMPLTAYVNFDAQAKTSGYTAGWKRSGHGQLNYTLASSGADAYIYTYHY